MGAALAFEEGRAPAGFVTGPEGIFCFGTGPARIIWESIHSERSTLVEVKLQRLKTCGGGEGTWYRVQGTMAAGLDHTRPRGEQSERVQGTGGAGYTVQGAGKSRGRGPRGGAGYTVQGTGESRGRGPRGGGGQEPVARGAGYTVQGAGESRGRETMARSRPEAPHVVLYRMYVDVHADVTRTSRCDTHIQM